MADVADQGPPEGVTISVCHFTATVTIPGAWGAGVPLMANARPLTTLPFPTATALSAISVPANVALAPIAPAPLTCQNTFDACASPVSTTWLPAAIAIAPPTWKTNTAFGSPPPSRVNVPVFDTAPAML